MNKYLLKSLVKNKDSFVPYIISKRQFEVIKKRLSDKKLTRTEQNYLYGAIKRKLHALSLIESGDKIYYFNSHNMLSERKKKANEILLNEKSKAFISGSFLFSKKYNDIDVFLISGKYKEEHREKFHYIHIKEKDLNKPAFQSAARCCVSNFDIKLPKLRKRKLSLDKILGIFQETVIDLLENGESKELKRIIAAFFLYNKSRMLDSYELNNEFKKLTERKNKIQTVSKMISETLKKNFNNLYLSKKLKAYAEILREDIKNISPNDHLKIYLSAYSRIINECKKAKGKNRRNSGR